MHPANGGLPVVVGSLFIPANRQLTTLLYPLASVPQIVGRLAATVIALSPIAASSPHQGFGGTTAIMASALTGLTFLCVALCVPGHSGGHKI